MKNLRIRRQLFVADPLQKERLLRAIKIILEHQEAKNASSDLCQSLNSQSAAGGDDRITSAITQTVRSTTELGPAPGT
jgi:hypothetical protein